MSFLHTGEILVDNYSENSSRNWFDLELILDNLIFCSINDTPLALTLDDICRALNRSQKCVCMLKIGLDIGTGFVKCVSNYGSIRFPSVYVRRIHGYWTDSITEAVGSKAGSMLSTMGASVISPINRGSPDSRYHRQAEMLIKESLSQLAATAESGKPKIVVGLPYHAFGFRDTMIRLVKRSVDAEACTVVPQVSGTLVDLECNSAIVVSIGQGTTEIVVIDDLEVIDGESSRWASNFVTKKLGRFAHLDPEILGKSKDICKRYSKILASNLVREITDMSEQYGHRYPMAISGGGLLLPGMNEELLSGLKRFKLLIPDDPVMSNARGLYKLVEEL